MIFFINKFLEGIFFVKFFGIEFSFFDYVRFFCDGVIVFREYFRCMFEIIEFLNCYFYVFDGKGLYLFK